jgi:hypothetical protein
MHPAERIPALCIANEVVLRSVHGFDSAPPDSIERRVLRQFAMAFSLELGNDNGIDTEQFVRNALRLHAHRDEQLVHRSKQELIERARAAVRANNSVRIDSSDKLYRFAKVILPLARTLLR